MEEFYLLVTLIFNRREILLVSRTKGGEHANRRLNNIAQSHHLARLTYSRLKDTDLCILVQEQYRQWNTYLRIITTR